MRLARGWRFPGLAGPPRADRRDVPACCRRRTLGSPRTLPPTGYGTLRQDDITVDLASGDLRLKVTPLAESVTRLTAPDTYQRLSALAGQVHAELVRRSGASSPTFFLVSAYSESARRPLRPRRAPDHLERRAHAAGGHRAGHRRLGAAPAPATTDRDGRVRLHGRRGSGVRPGRGVWTRGERVSGAPSCPGCARSERACGRGRGAAGPPSAEQRTRRDSQASRPYPAILRYNVRSPMPSISAALRRFPPTDSRAPPGWPPAPFPPWSCPDGTPPFPPARASGVASLAVELFDDVVHRWHPPGPSSREHRRPPPDPARGSPPWVDRPRPPAPGAVSRRYASNCRRRSSMSTRRSTSVRKMNSSSGRRSRAPAAKRRRATDRCRQQRPSPSRRAPPRGCRPGSNGPAGRQHHHGLHEVSELPDVARPGSTP